MMEDQHRRRSIQIILVYVAGHIELRRIDIPVGGVGSILEGHDVAGVEFADLIVVIIPNNAEALHKHKYNEQSSEIIQNTFILLFIIIQEITFLHKKYSILYSIA